ncbi:MAG: 50S ribosomal protein L4 [Acholeplasmataceae bacterium]|nr:50S ribosomal protein L4 [Acholeplasmataceae bacterium]
MQVQVYKQNGNKDSLLTLNEQIFNIEPNMQVLYDVVNAQRAAMRRGTADTKGRSEVRGGGRKPWRQKGTGRARHGSRRSPIWVGGGVTFGPTPRSYEVKVNRKVGRLAIKSALSLHLQKEQLLIVDKIEINEPKTKLFTEILNDLSINERVLFVDVNFSDNVILAARNISHVSLENASHTSVLQLMSCSKLVLTVDAVKYFEEVL